MKNALFILAGATAFSLASCSQEKTTDKTTTTTAPADGAMATSTTVTDETYHARGNRMADKFASDMKITDEPTKEKLRTAYYNRSKRYDTMHQKYASDTAGMATDMRQYNTDTDAEFQGVLTDPSQYKAYQSSRSTYDEATNLDNNTMQSNSGAMSDTTGAMSSGSGSGSTMSSSADNTSAAPTTSGSTTPGQGTMNADNTVSKSKTKLDNGAKIKVKGDEVKIKTADGQKMKM
ncbi:hypothetical protein [Hymenobacter psoromatis]|uniref:hypothetical protein n=1 Tax=Hymenobacter psoromatis TaxID=1484116 RepID=UPI001CC0538C|nr:hypothetical protein [Hymenobacter psoromatis]